MTNALLILRFNFDTLTRKNAAWKILASSCFGASSGQYSDSKAGYDFEEYLRPTTAHCKMIRLLRFSIAGMRGETKEKI